MNANSEKKRWPVAFAVVSAVIIASVAIALSYHDNPGRIGIAAIGDASGNTIVTWQNNKGIFAQRIDLSGQLLWGMDGVVVSGVPPDKSYTLTSDGAGGAIFLWYENVDVDHDNPAYFNPVDFYAQRMNAGGELLWGDGILIGDSNRIGVTFPGVVTDGSGGAIFAWNDYNAFYRALHDDILRLKKLDAGGNNLWGDEGIIITASSPFHPLTDEEKASGIKGTYHRSWPYYSGQYEVVSDGGQGAIVFWEDEITNRSDRVYAQRIDNAGRTVWPDKIVVADERLLWAESDGAGGAFVKTPEGTVYSGIGQVGKPLVVHISGAGEIMSTRGYSPDYAVIKDGLGGFFRIRIEEDPLDVHPMERRTVLYVQREDGTGEALWPEKRVVNPGEKQHIDDLKYVADGSGGIIIVWRLEKDSVPYGGVMAQKIDAEGRLMWSELGMPVFDDPTLKYQGVAEMFEDGYGGAIIIAALGTGALTGDMVYAQRLDAEGNLLWGDGIRINR